MLLAVATFALGLGTAALHLIGAVVHRRYLAHWNVDSTLFPRSADLVLVTGYDAVLAGALMVLSAIYRQWALFFLAVVVGVGIVFAGNRLLDHGVDALVKSRLVGWKWFRRGTIVLASGLGGASFVLIAVVMAVGVLSMPLAVAEASAAETVHRDAADFSKGCLASQRACVEIRRPSQENVRGYLLDSSPQHLAVFDVERKVARTFTREGVEIVSAPNSDPRATSER